MDRVNTVTELLQRLSDQLDWKFALGLHIRFANPTLLYSSYPKAWVEHYSERGLAFVDPTVRWAIANVGICDWSEFTNHDTHDVMGQAAEHGLVHGKVVSIGQTSRSFGFFAHPSRPIEDDAIESARSLLQQLHDATEGVEQMSATDLAPLRELSVPER